MTGRISDGFFAAAGATLDVLARDEVARRWPDASAIERFTVGGLAAHVLVATGRTEQVLDDPEPVGAELVDVARFYAGNRVDDPTDLEQGLHPLIRETAEDGAARGPEAVRDDFAALVERLRVRLPHERPDRLVPVLQVRGGATPLETYLATRIVELVVHTDDLAVSAGLGDVAPPPAAVDVVVEVFTAMARGGRGDLAVVRAFARRERASADVLRVL